jgi:hypothetical protein
MRRPNFRLPARALVLSAMLALGAVPALAQIGSTASVTINAGPHKGEYNFAPTESCVIAPFGQKPAGISVVLHAADSVLSIDMPNLDGKHANEIQVVLVIAEMRAGKGTSSVTYEIDTRPDATLEPFQKAERANKGITGKATTTLMEKDGSVLLSFNGTTASGIKLDGSLTCRKMS